jgi:hypothetical protein
MLASGSKIIDVENAQFNTMVCKGNMNFTPQQKNGQKKWREPAGAASRHYARTLLGGGPRAKPIQCTTTLAAFNKKKPRFSFCEHRVQPYQKLHRPQ